MRRQMRRQGRAEVMGGGGRCVADAEEDQLSHHHRVVAIFHEVDEVGDDDDEAQDGPDRHQHEREVLNRVQEHVGSLVGRRTEEVVVGVLDLATRAEDVREHPCHAHQ